MTPDEALRLWDEHNSQKYPAQASRLNAWMTKNPAGYCPDHSTGVARPIGLGVSAGQPSAPMEQV